MAEEKNNKPMYEQIYDDLYEQIQNKVYKDGDRVPSEKELAEMYNVSRITSKKALELLANEGLIVRKPGKGSFVKENATIDKLDLSEKNKQTRENPLLIGLVMTDFDYSYGTKILHGVEEAAREHACFPIIRRTLGLIENEVNAIKELVNLGVDGLIVFPAQGEYFNEEILKLVINKFPIVLIDRHFKGIAPTSICTDNVAATKKAIQHLFELGHRQIGLLSPPPIDTTAIEERIDGFIDAHVENGVAINQSLWITDITSTLPNAFTEENIRGDIEKIKAFLQEHQEITALFAVEYNIALLAKKAIEELGMRIPEDISIICFDGPNFPLQDVFTFTHLQQQEKEMGKKAVEFLMQMMEGETPALRHLLEAKLIIGDSTTKAGKK